MATNPFGLPQEIQELALSLGIGAELGLTPSSSTALMAKPGFRLITLPDGRQIEIPENPTEDEKRNLYTSLASEFPDQYGELLDEYRDIGGYTTEFFKGIPRGFASGALNIAQGAVGLVTPGVDTEAEKSLAALQSYIEQDSAVAADPVYRDTYAAKLGSGLGSFATFAVPGAAARLLGANPIGAATKYSTFGLAGASGVGEQSTRIMEQRELGKEISAGRELAALAPGLLIGLSEAVPVTNLFKKAAAFDPAKGSALRNIFARIDKSSPVAGTLYDDIARLMTSAAKQGGIEGLQEAVAGAAQDTVSRVVYDPDIEIGGSMMDDFLVGGGVGALADVIVDAMGGRRTVANQAYRDRETQLRQKKIEQFDQARAERIAAINKEAAQNIKLLPPPPPRPEPLSPFDGVYTVSLANDPDRAMSVPVFTQDVTGTVGGERVGEGLQRADAYGPGADQYTYTKSGESLKRTFAYNPESNQYIDITENIAAGEDINSVLSSAMWKDIGSKSPSQVAVAKLSPARSISSAGVEADIASNRITPITPDINVIPIPLVGGGAAGRFALVDVETGLPVADFSKADEEGGITVEYPSLEAAYKEMREIEAKKKVIGARDLLSSLGIPVTNGSTSLTLSVNNPEFRRFSGPFLSQFVPRDMRIGLKPSYSAEEARSLLSKIPAEKFKGANAFDEMMFNAAQINKDRVSRAKEQIEGILPNFAEISPNKRTITAAKLKELGKANNLIIDPAAKEFKTFAQYWTGTQKWEDMSNAQRLYLMSRIPQITPFARPTKFPNLFARQYKQDQFDQTLALMGQVNEKGENPAVSVKDIEQITGGNKVAAQQIFDDLVYSRRVKPAASGKIRLRMSEEQYQQERQAEAATIERPLVPEPVEKPVSPEIQAVQNENAEAAVEAVVQGADPVNESVAEQFNNALTAALNKAGLINLVKVRSETNKTKSLVGKTLPESVPAWFDPINQEIVVRMPEQLNRPDVTQEEIVDYVNQMMNHEIIHVMREADLITEAEWNTLSNFVRTVRLDPKVVGNDILMGQSKDETLLDNVRRRYAKSREPMTEEQILEEAIAEAYRLWNKHGGKYVAGKPQSIFKKILNYIKSFATAFKESGATNVEQIFSAMASGQVGQRTPGLSVFNPDAKAAIRSLRLSDRIDSGLIKKVSDEKRKGGVKKFSTPKPQGQQVSAAIADDEAVIPAGSAAAMFNQNLINENRIPGFKSREKLIEMNIDDFLNLAKPGYMSAKEQDISSLSEEGKKFDSLPFLWASLDENGVLKVEGHEGRHRARFLKKAGYQSMPVLLRTLDPNPIRWSEQNNPQRFDYVENWPTRIEAEAGSFSIPMPVSREQSMAPYSENLSVIHPEWATAFEPSVGGKIVYSDNDAALLRGFSTLTGQPVYAAVDRKSRSRTQVDIDSYTGNLFTPEKKKQLSNAKQQIVNQDAAMFERNPEGPFTGAASNVVISENVNPNYGRFLSRLMNSMGLNDIRVFLLHPEDTRNNPDKYKLYGDYASAMSAGLDPGEDGSIRPYGKDRKDFYISLKPELSETRSLEIIGHELGHLIERAAFNNASPETKSAIRAEYEQWLRDNRGKQGADLIRALRNRETAEAQASTLSPTARLNDGYWRSFGEWFADNTSKWVTTSEKPLGLVEEFFADVARMLRQLVETITGNRFVPTTAVKNFLDAMGPGSADAWISERTGKKTLSAKMPEISEANKMRVEGVLEDQIRDLPPGYIPRYNPNAPEAATLAAIEFENDGREPEMPLFAQALAIKAINNEDVDSDIIEKGINTHARIKDDDRTWGQKTLDLLGIDDGPGGIGRWFRFQFVDKDNEFRRQETELIGTENERKLMAETSVSGALGMLDRIQGIMAALINSGGIRWVKGDRMVTNDAEIAQDELAGYHEIDTSVPGLLNIFEKLQDGTVPNGMRQFKLYAMFKRIQGFRNRADIAREKLEQMKGQLSPDDIRKLELAIDMEKKARLINNPSNKEISETLQAIEGKYPDVVDAYNKYQDWNRTLIQFARDTQILTEEMAEQWKEWGDYFPFYKELEEMARSGSGYKKKSSLLRSDILFEELSKEAKDLNEADPYEMIIKNASGVLLAGLRNVAALRIMRNSVLVDEARLIDGPNPNEQAARIRKNGGYTQTVLEEGQELIYEIADPLLYQSMMNFGEPALNHITKILAMPSSLLREMVTRDPGFIATNTFRDSISAWITSPVGFTPIIDSIRNWNSEEMEQLALNGIIGGYDASRDPKDLVKYVKNQYRLRGIDVRNHTINNTFLFTKLWDALGGLSQKSDGAVRAAVYKRMLKDTGSEAQARLAAIDVINFSRRGANPLWRSITAAVTFLNARVQGFDKIYTTLSGRYSPYDGLVNPEYQRNAIQKRALLRLGMITAMTGAYFMMMQDNEEYKKARKEVRDDNWLVPTGKEGVVVKLPIPYEPGMIAKAIPEAFFNLMAGNLDARGARDSIVRQVNNATNLDIFGFQIWKPIADIMQNKNSFTKGEIIPYWVDRGVDRIEQYDDRTTEIAKGFARGLNALTGLSVSPMWVDYAANGYGGTIGTTLLLLADKVVKEGMGEKTAGTRADFTDVNNLPVIRRFFIDMGTSGSAMQQQFYELRDEVRRSVGTLNKMKKEGRVDEYLTYQASKRDILDLQTAVNSIDRYLKRYREYRRQIINSDLPSDQKRALLRELDADKDLRLTVVPLLRDEANLPVKPVSAIIDAFVG